MTYFEGESRRQPVSCNPRKADSTEAGTESLTSVQKKELNAGPKLRLEQ